MPILSLADEFADRFNVQKNLTDAALERLESRDWQKPDPSRELAYPNDKTAIIRVFGVLVDRRSFWELLGCQTSYESIAESLLYCQDAGIKNIVLDIDSPGGYASGVLNLVNIMNNARANGCKITAVVNSLCCSAAYRLACACDEIVALPESIVGSIGVNYILTDTHRQAAMRGQETVVISSSEFKWMGTPGTTVTDKQREDIRVNMVEPFYQTFCDEVKAARKLNDKELAAVADGRSFRAEQALELKLVDRIATLADALEAVGATDKTGVIVMAKNEQPITENVKAEKPTEPTVTAPVETAPTAATLEQLDQSFPKASAEFKIEQLCKSATLDAAKDAYIAMLENQLAVTQAAVVTKPEPTKEAEPQTASKMLTLPGSPALEKTEPILPTAQPEESASDQLKKIIAEKEKAGKTSEEAAMEAFREHPELREQWIMDSGRQRH